MHTCWHTHPQGLYSTELSDVNYTMIDLHLADLTKLMQNVRNAIDISNTITGGNGTRTVVILTSGVTYAENASQIDECIMRFNRVVETEAHKYGFAVLERGEIERRLLFKSLYSKKPYLTPVMHLPQPAQNLIATCLLSMFSCLQDLHMGQISPELLINIQNDYKKQRGKYSIPLHSPPS
jgi:hypothetical protein